MSFRKRSEPLVPGRLPPRGSPMVPGRAPGGPVPSPMGFSRGQPIAKPTRTESVDIVSANPGVRPSVSNSDPTISTGCSDLDRILIHQGLPLGHSLLVEESGTTDFSSVLLRNFAAQGVFHARLEKEKKHCHVVVLGPPSVWANNLPGEYKGSSREQKKAKLAADSSKISVLNLADKDLKIAWRYGLKQPQEEGAQAMEVTNELYNTQFDIALRLSPGASPHEITFVALQRKYQDVVNQLRDIIQRQLRELPTTVIRIVVPGFLNPSIYPPGASTSTFVIPFFHSLQSLLRTFSQNVALIASIPLDLYPRDKIVTHMLEQIADGVVHLQPFNPEMEALIERAYKNEPNKIQHGFVNVIKVPVLSAKGMMMIRTGEFAFKNGRKKFEIEDWGIPVEDEAPEEEKQTKQNIEF